MKNLSISTAESETDSKAALPRPAKFVIVWEPSESDAGGLAKLRNAFEPLVEAGGNALGDIYACIVRSVLERIEKFEDRQAERNARLRRAARTNSKSSSH